MHPWTRLAAACLLALTTTATMADERPDHYGGIPAENLAQALGNLSAANERLEALINQERLTDADLEKVHRLSYTLENALHRLDEEVEAMQAQVETIHQASERRDAEAVSTTARDYLPKAHRLRE